MKSKYHFLMNSIYIVAICIFMYLLHRFNNILFELNLDKKSFELLKYDNYMAVKYFIFTIIFLMLGIVLTLQNYKELKRMLLYEDYIYIWIIVCMVLEVILLIFLIKLISIPILKAILIAIATFFSLGFIFSE